MFIFEIVFYFYHFSLHFPPSKSSDTALSALQYVASFLSIVIAYKYVFVYTYVFLNTTESSCSIYMYVCFKG